MPADNVDLAPLRTELAHCRSRGESRLNKEIQMFADLVVTAETTKKLSDMYTAWAFVADTAEGKAAFEALATAALKAGN